MKKTIFLLLIVTFWAITVNAYDFQIGELRYSITSIPDKTVEVLKSDNTSGDVVIPASVGYNGVDFTVTRIANSAFEYCFDITSFTIPNTVTSIGVYGFGWCWHLNTIILDNPNSDFTCGSDAFDYDWRSFKNVNVNNIDKKSLLENGAGIMEHLPAHDLYIEGRRITDFDVPKGTKKINTFFKNAMSLKRIIFASEVQSVVDNAFYHCDSLHTVYLSQNLTMIGNSAFAECASLRTIYSPSFNPAEAQISSFPNGAYMFATVYIPKGTLSLYKNANGWEKFENYIETDEFGIYTDDEVYYTLNLNVNSEWMGTATGSGTYKKGSAVTITAVANAGYEFSQWSDGNTDNPRSLILTQDTVLTAEFESAACQTVASGTCGAQGDNLAWELSCDGVLTINGIGKMTNFIYYGTAPWYSYNEQITLVKIQEGVTSIGNYAFWGLHNMEEIIFPTTLDTIGQNSVEDAFSLTSVCVPRNVKFIGYDAFHVGTNIISVDWQAVQCTFDDKGGYGPLFSGSTLIRNIVIHEAVVTLPSYMFDNIHNATITSYAINPPVAYQSTFERVDKSIPIYVPCASIGAYRTAEGWKDFTNIQPIAECEKFTIIWQDEDGNVLKTDEVAAGTIPSYTGAIPTKSADDQYTYTFAGWTPEITAVTGNTTYTATFTETVNTYVVTFVDGTTVLGTQTVEYGQAATAPEVEADPCRTLTWDKDFSYITGDLTVTAVWTDIFPVSGICGAKGDNLTWELTCEGVLTVSGTGAMADWNGIATPWEEYKQRITTVILPDGITKIGLAAFKGCANLTAINIPEGVKGIESQTFSGCTSLDNIVLPQSVSFIRSLAFYNCSSLAAINIPDNVTVIGKQAFRKCSALTDIAIPGKVASIGVCAFYDCSALATLTLGDGLEEIQEEAFYNCASLAAVTIPGSVTAIGDYAFHHCGSLASLVIDNSAAEIGQYAFNECASLTTAVLGDRLTGIGVNAFYGCAALLSVDIPATVTSVGDYAFRNCPAMVSATFRTVVPPAIGKAAFFETPCMFYVPCGGKEAYTEALEVDAGRVEATGTLYTIHTGVTVWEDELPYMWEDKTFTGAGTQTATLKTIDGCDSIVVLTLRVRSRNIVLQEREDNGYYDRFAEDYNGLTVSTVTLNRQFTQGKWATLCLPFDVTSGMMTSLNMRGRVYEFKRVETDADGGLTLYTSVATSIAAGKGYIVNANARMAARVSFVFSNVTINTDADKVSDLTAPDAYDGLDGYSDGTGTVTLVGTLRNGLLTGTGGTTYMGLKSNKFFTPNHETGTPVYAYRGIFRSTVPLNAQRVRIIVDGEDKGEWIIENEELIIDNSSAVKFIENGILYIERNGKTYNAQGQLIIEN